MKVEARRNSVGRQCDDRGEGDVSGTAIATELSAEIVDVSSGELVNVSARWLRRCACRDGSARSA